MNNEVAKWVASHPSASTWIQSHAKSVIGAVAALAASIISLLTTFNAVHWTPTQTSLVSAETAAVVALFVALIAHFWPGTAQEPVAVAASFTAFVLATLTLGTGFLWWSLSKEQIAALVAVLSTAIGLGAALIARSSVDAKKTPAVAAVAVPVPPAPPVPAGAPVAPVAP
jgi:hypothetical protein